MNSLAQNSSLAVKNGPSGRPMAQSMDPSIAEAINQHLTMERKASIQYYANSIWFAEKELRGFSEFYKKESSQELTHAHSFANYLIARGQKIILSDLPSPTQSWTSIEEVISDSFIIESDTTASLQQIYAISERDGDIRTTVFLDPIIENQIASEDEFAYILGKTRFSKGDSSSILLIDAELAK